MPTIQDVIGDFRQRVIDLEDAATERLTQSYTLIYNRLRTEQDALMLEVANLRAQGKEPSRGQIERMKRYRSLIRQTQDELGKFAVVIESEVRRNGPGAATIGAELAEAATREAIPAQAQASVMATFTRLDAAAIEALTGALDETSPLWTQTLARFGDEAARNIGNTLVTGLAAGWNPKRMAREMTNAWGVPLTDALRIARTETLRAYRAATLATYRQNPHIIRGWIWTAALDARTCMACVALHGTRFGPEESLDDHPNGRCTAVPETVSWRDLGIDLDEPEWIPRPGDGERWFEGLDEATQRAMMGPSKFAAWQDGAITLRDLIGQRDDPDWGRTFSEASLVGILGDDAEQYKGVSDETD